ncbi:MAG: type II secretion system F family protein [Deltaproteobacteria bacterium]|jgi:type IV pilus assembly protein PilC|nr:type II secretion system F family protein [Deltaproteobacteria bacterium]
MINVNSFNKFLQGIFENQNVLIKFPKPKIKAKDIITFTHQLAVMLEAGITISDSLKNITELLLQDNKNITAQPKNTMLELIEQIMFNINIGKTLSSALQEHSQYFSPVYIAMVQAGEASGCLDITLKNLVTYLEKNEKIKKQIISASIYPSCVILSASGVSLLLLTFVIPTFAEMFNDLGSKLPALTQAVLNLSNFLCKNLKLILTLTILTIYFAYQEIKTERFKNYFDKIMFKIPIIGNALRNVAIVRFANVLATLITAGIPLVPALSISSSTTNNQNFIQEVMKIKNGIETGKSLTEQVQASAYFPQLFCQLLHIGEITGALDIMLKNVANFYEEENNNFFANFKQFLEPIIILILGIIVGTLVVAMYLPILQLGKFV